MFLKKGHFVMYIKKPVLIICAVVLILATVLGTVMVVNPFGAFQFADFLKFNEGIFVLRHFFYEDVDAEKLLDGVLLGASLSVEDPYTMYLDKSLAERFTEEMESDAYTGVGLYITSDETDGHVTVVSPLADSPGEKAGIVTGDKILEVNGEAVNGSNIDEVASMMKGEENTEVKLKVLKKADESVQELTLIRAVIERDTVSSKMLDNNVGYIQITQFGLNTAEEFIDHFNSLVEEKMASVVIDLRNNPGGYVEMAVAMADCFVDEGEIVYTLNKQGKKTDYNASEGKTKVKMVILTNGGTASASEIFVGAMKDHKIATTVGEKTFGKGVTQIPYQFRDGSIMKITDSRYYTPNGVCIDHEGIVPDIEIKMSDEEYANASSSPDPESDKQLKKAVEVLLGD